MSENDERFTEFFREVYPRLHRFLATLLADAARAEELAQESLLRLYRSPLRGAEASDARNWVFRVARNLALNERKRSATAARVAQLLPPAGTLGASTPESQLAARRELATIWRLIGELSEQQRAALLLREYEAMSYREIGRVLNISKDNVKVSIFRARRRLREGWRARRQGPDRARNTR